MTSDRRFGPRDYWWMILLYFAGSIIMGVVVGLTAVGVAWLFGMI